MREEEVGLCESFHTHTQKKQLSCNSKRTYILKIKILSHTYWKTSLYKTQIIFIEHWGTPHQLRRAMISSTDSSTLFFNSYMHTVGFPVGTSGKELYLPMQEMLVQSLGQEDPLEECNPLQYFCLENSMDKGAWWATVHRVAKSRTRLKWLSTHAHMHTVKISKSKKKLISLPFLFPNHPPQK